MREPSVTRLIWVESSCEDVMLSIRSRTSSPNMSRGCPWRSRAARPGRCSRASRRAARTAPARRNGTADQRRQAVCRCYLQDNAAGDSSVTPFDQLPSTTRPAPRRSARESGTRGWSCHMQQSTRWCAGRRPDSQRRSCWRRDATTLRDRPSPGLRRCRWPTWRSRRPMARCRACSWSATRCGSPPRRGPRPARRSRAGR
jgi:hypothetical protein